MGAVWQNRPHKLSKTLGSLYALESSFTRCKKSYDFTAKSKAPQFQPIMELTIPPEACKTTVYFFVSNDKSKDDQEKANLIPGLQLDYYKD